MLRVLVVDDQPAVRATVVTALHAKGIEVVAAESAAAALKEFARERFDVAVVDIYMPGVDGVKLIKAFRERDQNFPVVVMSGVLLGDSDRTALDFFPGLPGMSNITCIKKPFRMAELLAAIQKAVTVVAA